MPNERFFLILCVLGAGCAGANDAAEDGGNRDGGDVDATIDDGSVGRDDGVDGAPEDGSPDDGSRDDGAPEDGSPDDGSLEDGAPEDGATRDAGVDAEPLPLDAVLWINEIVAYPNNDWSRSDGAGTPFVSGPGAGAVTSRDQLVELYNPGPLVVDLTGCSLTYVAGRTTRTTIGATSAVVVTSPGSAVDALRPGDFAVIGDPEGFLSTDGYYVLTDASGRVLDDVEVGGIVPSRDFERDGTGDGAPDPTWNAFARGTFDEAIARPEGRADSDDDADDFERMAATPLAPNVSLDVPIESERPVVVANTAGTSVEVTSEITITLSEPIDWASADRAVTMFAAGVPVRLDFSTFTARDSVIVIDPTGRLPFATDIEVRVLGGALGLSDKAGNPLLADHTFTFHTEDAPSEPGVILINEICSAPYQDWSRDEEAPSQRFSGSPGTGLVDSEDEWIELLYRGASVADLGEHRLTVYTGATIYGPPRSTTYLASSLAFARVFGSGGGLGMVAPFDRVVIGNPRGALSHAFYVELRNGAGRLVDFAEVGGTSVEEDRGGDGIGNGAPTPGLTDVEHDDEVVARTPDGADTGSSSADFVWARASMGAPN